MTSTAVSQTYGSFYASVNKTITASGTGNVISAGRFGIAANGASTITLTLNTPLPTDSLTASSNFANYLKCDWNRASSKSGSGTVVLTGTSTYTGATSVNGGTLYVNGALSGSSAVTVAQARPWAGRAPSAPRPSPAAASSRAAIQRSGHAHAQRPLLEPSTTINITPATSLNSLNVTGNNGLTAGGPAGSVAVNIGSTSLAPGTYPLIGYSGAIQVTGSAAFTLGTVPADSNSYTLQNGSGAWTSTWPRPPAGPAPTAPPGTEAPRTGSSAARPPPTPTACP